MALINDFREFPFQSFTPQTMNFSRLRVNMRLTTQKLKEPSTHVDKKKDLEMRGGGEKGVKRKSCVTDPFSFPPFFAAIFSFLV